MSSMFDNIACVERVRECAKNHMHDVCEIAIDSGEKNQGPFGDDVEEYHWLGNVPCGFVHKNNGRTGDSTGDILADAMIRIPYDYDLFVENHTRIRVTHRASIELEEPDYYVVFGTPQHGVSCIVCLLRYEQSGAQL